jgi:FKBP-type peptidyl-prolyl cis-trans isomerase FklB
MNVKRMLLCALAAVALASCEEPGVLGEIKRAEKEIAQKEATEAAESEARVAARADGAKNASASQAFLERNAKEEGVTTTRSGLQYRVVRSVDSGPRPGPQDEVLVNYEGRLIDGSVFDSSYERGQPAPFQISGVIPGWTEGLQMMRPGEEYTLYIPSDLAYGQDAPPDIGPNQALVFRVELIAFRKPSGEVFGQPPAPQAPPPPQ